MYVYSTKSILALSLLRTLKSEIEKDKINKSTIIAKINGTNINGLKVLKYKSDSL
jgi:hypothetical protein